LPGFFALGIRRRIVVVDTIAVGVTLVDAAGVFQAIVIITCGLTPGLFDLVLLRFGLVFVGLLFLAQLVLGLQNLIFLGEARRFGGVTLLNRDLGLFGGRGIGPVGIGDVPLGIHTFVNLVGADERGRKCAKQTCRERGDRSNEPEWSL